MAACSKPPSSPTNLSSSQCGIGYHSVEENESMRKSSANQKLSSLDMNMPRLYGIRWVLCFPLPESVGKDEVFADLKTGLEHTKAAIPWLSGNIGAEEGVDPKRNRIQILQGSHNIHFKSKDLTHILPSFAELKEECFPISKFSSNLVSPCGVIPTSTIPPVMLAQANFIIGGLLLTIAIHHSASDVQGGDNILETWAYNTGAASGAFSWIRYDPTSNDRIPLSFQLPGANILDFPEYILRPTADMGTSEGSIEKLTQSALSTPALLTKLFYFSPEALITLKKRSGSYLTNDAVSSFIWRHITFARYPNEASSNDVSKSSSLLYTLDIRSRTSPPLSPTYLGNATLANKTSPVPISLLKSATGHTIAAAAVRQSLNTFRRPNRIPLTIGLLDSRPDPTDYKFSSNHFLGPDIIYSSWADIGVYKRAWGYLGPPVAFRTPYEGADGILTVLPRLENGALEILVSLEKGTMDNLLMDGKFVEFAKVRV